MSEPGLLRGLFRWTFLLALGGVEAFLITSTYLWNPGLPWGIFRGLLVMIAAESYSVYGTMEVRHRR